MNNLEDEANYAVFRECLSEVIIEKLATKPAKKQKRRAAKGRKGHGKTASVVVDDGTQDQSTSDAEDLGEFVDYLATEIFTALPEDLRTLSYTTFTNDAHLQARYSPSTDGQPPSPTLDALIAPMPPSVLDSLTTYGLLPVTSTSEDLLHFLAPIITSYISQTTTSPIPEHGWSSTRTTACEICERDWIPLTYHHLIPREVHAKAVKRGWVEEWELNKVAWLCRACHSFVHRCASNEELAREWRSVESLRGRDDVQEFAGWVGRVRWKAR